MPTKELIQIEINKIDEKYLDELYELIKDFSETKQETKKPSLMARLRQIKFEGPEDLSINHELYAL